MNPNRNDDPMESAMNAQPLERTRIFFGQCTVDVWYCALVKGTGKVPYDSTQHKRRFTAIDLVISPLPNSPAQFSVERKMIAESNEWAGIVLPSLKAITSDPQLLRHINNRWVQIDQVPSGGKYTNKAGEEKERTTVKFLAIYDSEEACQAAADAFWAARRQSEEAEGEEAPTVGTPPAQPAAAAAAPVNGGERETAKKFLPALWAASGRDPEKFAAKIASMPLVAKYFDISSAEVVAVIGPAVVTIIGPAA